MGTDEMNIKDITILKKCVSDSECEILNKWVIDNQDNDFFLRTNPSISYGRKTTRRTDSIQYDLPHEIKNIYKNIKKELRLENFKPREVGKEGIISSISFKDSFMDTHTDAHIDGFATYHLLIKTSENEEGGNLVINNKEYNLNKGECLAFFVSHNPHSVTKYLGTNPRIVWVYSMHIPNSHISYNVDNQ